MSEREPIEEIIESDDISIDSKEKLKLIEHVKNFSEIKLGLKKTKNYQHYVQLKQPYVSYLLTVSPKYELRAHEWTFPIIGNVPYKGFPTSIAAEKESKKFPNKEYDTFIRGVSAYSTLGWFSDPVLSSMLEYNKRDLVDLVIHESLHATLFIKSQAEFNERLASFIGYKGAQEYYKSFEGDNSENVSWLQNENHDDVLFSQFLTQKTDILKSWYKNTDKISDLKKTIKINEIVESFKKDLLPKLKTKKYLWFLQQQINNAFLVGLITYNANYEIFEKALSKETSLRAFIEFCKTLEDSDTPEQDLIKHYHIEEHV